MAVLYVMSVHGNIFWGPGRGSDTDCAVVLALGAWNEVGFNELLPILTLCSTASDPRYGFFNGLLVPCDTCPARQRFYLAYTSFGYVVTSLIPQTTKLSTCV